MPTGTVGSIATRQLPLQGTVQRDLTGVELFISKYVLLHGCLTGTFSSFIQLPCNVKPFREYYTKSGVFCFSLHPLFSSMPKAEITHLAAIGTC